MVVLRVREGDGAVQVLEVASPLTREDARAFIAARTALLDRGIRHVVVIDARGITRVPGPPVYDLIAWERRLRPRLVELCVGLTCITRGSLIRDLAQLVWRMMRSPIEAHFTDDLDDALAWADAMLEDDELPRTGENTVA